MRDTEIKRHRHRQREKQAPCREPDMELDPRSPGSHPGLNGAKLLSHRGCPLESISDKVDGIRDLRANITEWICLWPGAEGWALHCL